MAPLVKELEKADGIESLVCVTAQHRRMLDMVLDLFEIKPDFDLNIMEDRQTLASITTKALEGLSGVFGKVRPHVVLVHGDTTTTLAGSLAAFYNKVKLGHVEAGLRTYDKYSPYPEEMNRRLTGAIADFNFAPTASNRANLLREGADPEKIYVTGNTVIDALSYTAKPDYIFRDNVLRGLDFNANRVILVTAHRRENLGEPLKNICKALRRIAADFNDVTIVYPVHLNPAVRDTVFEILSSEERIHLIDPLDVDELHNLMKRCYMVMTDSGGLQEEAPAFGKPVLVLRNETERPEAVAAGTVKVAGCDEEDIYSLAAELLTCPDEYARMAHAVNPYGDGRASERIVQALKYEFGISAQRPKDF